MDIRHNQTVELVRIPDRFVGNEKDLRVKIGCRGKVIAMVAAQNSYLVKWAGRTWPVSVDRNDIQLVKN